MVRDQCKNMTPVCLLFFGVVCALQAVFEVVILVSMIGGRREHNTVRTSYNEHEATYKTTVTVHPFFDASQGLIYNFQSAARIVSPVVFLLSAGLSYYSSR